MRIERHSSPCGLGGACACSAALFSRATTRATNTTQNVQSSLVRAPPADGDQMMVPSMIARVLSGSAIMLGTIISVVQHIAMRRVFRLDVQHGARTGAGHDKTHALAMPRGCV